MQQHMLLTATLGSWIQGTETPEWSGYGFAVGDVGRGSFLSAVLHTVVG
jgi:hypothetical protein